MATRSKTNGTKADMTGTRVDSSDEASVGFEFSVSDPVASAIIFGIHLKSELQRLPVERKQRIKKRALVAHCWNLSCETLLFG